MFHFKFGLSLTHHLPLLAVGGVSSELSPAKVNYLLLNPKTQSLAFNIKFINVHIGLLDRNRLSFSQRAEIAASKYPLNYLVFDFSRPVSLNISFTKLNQRVQQIARVLLVPGSIRQLEKGAEDRKLNESLKDPKIHTACFWFQQFKVKERKFNATVDHVKASEENLHCISLPTNDSGLMLNFDYKDPPGVGIEFKRSIHFFWNPKTITAYELVMNLKNVRSERELTRFMQDELKNPSAKIVERVKQYTDLCEPPSASFYQKLLGRTAVSSDCDSEDRPETVVFESELAFSGETKQFISKVCNTGRRNGWLSLKNKLWQRPIADAPVKRNPSLNDSWIASELSCPVEIHRKIPRNFPVNGELSLVELSLVVDEKVLN